MSDVSQRCVDRDVVVHMQALSDRKLSVKSRHQRTGCLVTLIPQIAGRASYPLRFLNDMLHMSHQI